jgi:hypothetical protein
MVKQFFIPTMLGAILFVWLVITQSTAFRVTSMSVPAGTSPQPPAYLESEFGFPPVLHVSSGRNSAVKIYWKNVLLVLAAAYALTMPLARWITGYETASGETIGPVRSGARGPVGAMLYVMGACVVVGAVGAVVIRALATAQDVSLLEMWWGLTMTALIVAVPTTLIVMSVRRRRWRRSQGVRGFAVEPASLSL